MQVRKNAVTLWVLALLGMVVVSGCGPVTVETPTPETAALQATQTAITLAQLEVELEQTRTALVATQTAMAFTATPTATPQAEPTATPTPVLPTATPEPTDTPTVGLTDTPTSSTPTDTPTLPPSPPTPQVLVIYDDALRPGWEDWSWDCQRNLSSAASVHEGQYAIAVDYEKGWGGLAFGRHDPISMKEYNRVEFWVHGGDSGGQLLRVSFHTYPSGRELPAGGMSINNPSYIEGGVVSPNTWKLVSIPLDLDAVDVSIVKFTIMDNSGSAQPTFYIDEVVLVGR